MLHNDNDNGDGFIINSLQEKRSSASWENLRSRDLLQWYGAINFFAVTVGFKIFNIHPKYFSHVLSILLSNCQLYCGFHNHHLLITNN